MSDDRRDGAKPTRRDALRMSAAVVAGAVLGERGAAGAADVAATGPVAAPFKLTTQPAVGVDPYAIAARFQKFLRVTDVTDGLDAVGRADLTLMDPGIRPLWMGCRFWGPAVTMRVLPSNRRMPEIEKKDALLQHAIWGRAGAWHAELNPHLKPGCVVVMSNGGAKETGYWGSNNTLDMMSRGVAGIVTEGQCRDTDEVIMQQCRVACHGIGRPIIPGRVELMDVDVPISCGGVMVRPGDIVGCDWDGCVVVPLEVARDVLVFAARIAVADKKARRKLYEKVGRAMDETVDWEGAAQEFKDLL